MVRLLLLVVLALSVLVGCGEDSSDIELQSFDRVQVGAGEKASEVEPMGLELDASTSRSGESREAVLAILEGDLLDREKRPYEAELVRTIDAELYRDIDQGPVEPKFWITRAKVVDGQGETLWQDRINSFFQVADYLKVILNQRSDFEFTLQQIRLFGKSEYPELFEFPVRVPVGLEGGEEFVLEVPDTEGDYYEVIRLDIDKLVEQAEPPRHDGEAKTLVENGPPEERTDVVILSDGYTAGQKQEFLGDAEAVVEEFQTTAPFEQHVDLMNFHTVWTPSQESGAGYDCIGQKRDSCNRFRETFYRYTFMVSAIADLMDLDFAAASARVAMPLEVARMFEVAAQVPYDEVLLLSNTERRSGFAGMYAGVLTAFDDRQNFPKVAVHEFGHSFGTLGDEYYIETDPCLDNRPRVPLPANISGTAERDELKWSHWVSEETSLPTSPLPQNPLEPGAFERAYNCKDLYRPATACKMKSSTNSGFCPVCAEKLVQRMYDHIDMIKPGFPKVTRQGNTTLIFEAGIRGTWAEVEWQLGGQTIGRSPRLVVGADTVGMDWEKLELRVEKAGDFVRREDPRLEKTFSWWVRGR